MNSLETKDVTNTRYGIGKWKLRFRVKRTKDQLVVRSLSNVEVFQKLGFSLVLFLFKVAVTFVIQSEWMLLFSFLAQISKIWGWNYFRRKVGVYETISSVMLLRLVQKLIGLVHQIVNEVRGSQVLFLSEPKSDIGLGLMIGHSLIHQMNPKKKRNLLKSLTQDEMTWVCFSSLQVCIFFCKV